MSTEYGLFARVFGATIGGQGSGRVGLRKTRGRRRLATEDEIGGDVNEPRVVSRAPAGRLSGKLAIEALCPFGLSFAVRNAGQGSA